MGLTKYLKAAFLNQWNLLLFLGATGFAALSGRFDIFEPLVFAAEVAYLAALGTHPRFQHAIDAAAAKSTRQEGTDAVQSTAKRILSELPKRLSQRFEALMVRCAELRQISLQMRETGQSDDPPPLDDAQLESLDRLLWMFLRLLYTQHSLSQFLSKTSEADIQQNIQQLEERLKSFEGKPGEERRQRITKVIEDNLQTSRLRLENYRKAQENHELMCLEIDRLENTIQSLSELAVNRHEPNFISGQIDQVAASMVQTERTMGELQFVTGLTPTDDEVPSMLRGGVAMQRH